MKIARLRWLLVLVVLVIGVPPLPAFQGDGVDRQNDRLTSPKHFVQNLAASVCDKKEFPKLSANASVEICGLSRPVASIEFSLEQGNGYRDAAVLNYSHSRSPPVSPFL